MTTQSNANTRYFLGEDTYVSLAIPKANQDVALFLYLEVQVGACEYVCDSSS